MRNVIILAVFILFIDSLASSAIDTDKKCKEQNEKFLKGLKADKFITEYKFSNESKKSVLLSWSPKNKESLVLVSTDASPLPTSSNIYISESAGVTFTKITDKFNGGKIAISREIGLQRNQYNPDHIIIISINTHGHTAWISTDDGKTWKKSVVPFIFGDIIHFYEKRPKWGATLSSSHVLYGTTDGGNTWKKLQENVEKFSWSSHEQDPIGTIYFLRKTSTMGILSAFFNENTKKVSDIGVTLDLMKLENFGSKKPSIKKKHANIWQFSARGKFLYISMRAKNSPIERYMKVSTDGAETFKEVQLMSITPDRFYSVMDMSEGLIFMHVDNPGNTGHGDLYTSGADGVLYSKSLGKHLYPNFPSVSDFYRVLSMRGTYITTQMNKDNSMHTVISFNRGAEWRSLRKPTNAECQGGISNCALQISSLYSKVNRVATHMPLSVKSAAGIILAHGHAHATLQTTPPDVYVTSDGGYNWNRALVGPHKYQIADHGGLLVAVPTNDETIVKFSTDEGRCWHSYKFTKDAINVTGVLTEPNNKIMKIIIWGYGVTDHIWRVYSIDFQKAITRPCSTNDYEDWTPHAEMTHASGKNEWNGCLLGVKETFKRLKKDSWCANGQSYEVTKNPKACPCTKDDYECEYGYSRPVNDFKCVKNPLIKELDSCIKGDLKKILTQGYRKLPGDKCKKGFHPDPSKQISLKKKCGADDKGIEVENGHHEHNKDVKPKNQKQTKFDESKVVWIVAGICLALIATVLVAVMVSRYRQLRERHVNYKYSLLNTQNEDAFDTAVDVGLLSEQENKTTLSANGSDQPSITQGTDNPIVRSYHDDSDVDMLE